MEDSDSASHQESSSDETEIVLEGKKAPSLDKPTATTAESKHPSSTKQTPGRIVYSRVSSMRKAHSSSNLVLQMYSHIQTQKKQEQEKNAMLARAERKRQKLKKDLFKDTFSDTSSLNRFGAYWTHCRVVKAHQLGLEETSDSMSVNNGRNSLISSVFPKVQQEQETGDVKEDKNRRIDIPSASSVSPNRSPARSPDRAQERDRHHPRRFTPQTSSVSPKPNVQPANSTISHKDKHDSNNKTRDAANPSFVEHSHNPGNNTPRPPNYNSGKNTHVLKGPGRVHIRFSTSPAPVARRHRSPDRQLCYEWESMQAGALSSARPKWITLDGNML